MKSTKEKTKKNEINKIKRNKWGWIESLEIKMYEKMTGWKWKERNERKVSIYRQKVIKIKGGDDKFKLEMKSIGGNCFPVKCVKIC